MSHTEKSPFQRPDADKLLAFDLAGRQPTQATNSRRKKTSGRSVIACIALLPFFGILMSQRNNSSLDRNADTQVSDQHLDIDAAAPSLKTDNSLSDGWPFPDMLAKFEAPVISDAASSTATERRASPSAELETLLLDAVKTEPVSSVPAIPMSAFPTDERIWTKSSGKYLLASALAYDELKGTVMLRSSDGRVLSTVAIEELCPADLEFLSQLTELAAGRTSQ